jgi:uncharacterized repeat protein (TIGR02543 family)
MKRDFQTISILSLILASFLIVHSEVRASVTSPPIELNGYKGDPLEIPIQLSATAAVAGLNGELNFDPDLFETPIVNTGPGAEDFTVRQALPVNGVLRFVVYPSPLNTLKLDTAILQVSLTVAPGLTEDVDTTLTYTSVAASDLNANSMSGVSFGAVSAHLRAAGAPEAPQNPTPASGAIGVGIATPLGWSASPGAESYQVFLWKSADSKPTTPTAVDLTTPQYDPPADFEYDTPYSWQVVAVNADGETEGAVWTFTTAQDPVVKYTLTLVADPINFGTVSRAPDQTSYTAGTQITLTASPVANYMFLGWMDGATTLSTEVSFVYTMPAENTTITASFGHIKFDFCSVGVVADPAEGGTVSKSPDSAAYRTGIMVTLSAVAAKEYTFAGWYDGSTTVSTEASFVYTVEHANKIFTAKFKKIEVTPTYTLTLTVDPSNFGTVSKSPDQTSYTANAQVTLKAIAGAQYEFRGWLDGATTVSKAGSFKYTMPAENKTLTAKFKVRVGPPAYTLEVVAAPVIGGTVSKSPDQATYTSGTQVTLSAVPAEGYDFTWWTDGVTSVSSEASFVYTMGTASKIFTAKFKKVPVYNVVVSAIPGSGGTVSKTPDLYSYREGVQVTLQAIPANGYEFRGWTDGDTTVSTAASFLYTVASVNVTFKANFKLLPPDRFTVSAVASPANAGTVSKLPDQSSYTTGTTVTLAVTENNGFKFIAWLDGSTTVSTDLSFQYTVTAENKVFTAKFRTIPPRLAAPENVQATVDVSSYLVQVTWNPVPDATHYQVLRATVGQAPVSVAFDDWIEGTSFTDDSVVPGVNYLYTVKASINAGERASDPSATATGRAKADPSVVAANYKVTYKKGMQLQKVVAGGVADLNFVVGGVTNGTIKIARLKRLPSATADDPAKGIAYLLNVTEITTLTINGDVKTMSVAAPVYNLASNGVLKSFTATSPVNHLSFREAGILKLSATKDSSVPYFARTRITSGNSALALSILASGVVIEDLSILQPVKMVKAATKTYKTVARVKTTSLGAIGLAQDFDSKVGVVSEYNANGPCWMLLGGIAGVTKTLVSVTGGSIEVDSLEGSLDKILVSGGNIQCWEIVSNLDIRLLQAKAKKVAGVAVGGRLGALNAPEAMTVWAKTNLLSIVGDSGISGRFVAGYAYADNQPSANYTGAIKTITAKAGGVIEGHADLSSASVAKLKFRPAKPAETQFAIHTAADQE